MAPSTTVKRSLFQTPTRASKRSKTSKSSTKSTTMKIPRSLMPETKQYVSSILSSATTNYAYASIPSSISQGDDGNDFIGSKFRISRIRVNYDFSQLSLTSGVRVSVVIPKDPSTYPILTSTIQQWDTQTYTVLHDMILPDSPDTATGTFDVTGPINVHMSSAGSTPLRNNVYLFVYSTGNGSALQTDFSYSVWFTDN